MKKNTKVILYISFILSFSIPGFSTQFENPSISNKINEAQPEIVSEAESFESPYFIDGVHCNGIPSTLDSEYWTKTADQKKRISNMISQQQCDSLFGTYGISKYNWYTPEQIENLQYAIRKSNDFEVKDMSLKKSSTPGHVHLIVTIELKSEKHYSIGSSYELYGNKDGATAVGKGLNLGVTLPLQDNLYKLKINASHYSYQTKKSLLENSNWTNEEKSLNENPIFFNQQIGLSYTNTIPFSALDFGVETNFVTHNINLRRQTALDSSFTFNLVHHSVNEFSKTSWGLVYDSSTISPFEISETSESKQLSRIGILASLDQGDPERQSLNIFMKALAPATSEDSGLILTDLKLNFAMEHFFNQFYVSVNSTGPIGNKNLESGLKRRFENNGHNSDLELGFNKTINTKNGRLKLTPFIGSTTSDFAIINKNLRHDNGSLNETGKTGVKLTLDTGTFDISGSLTYFNSRLH